MPPNVSPNFAYLAYHDPGLVADRTVTLFKLRQFGLPQRAAAKVGSYVAQQEGQQQLIDRLAQGGATNALGWVRRSGATVRAEAGTLGTAPFDQSLQAKAFRRELVPHDHNDEAADVMLAHLNGQATGDNSAAVSTRQTKKRSKGEADGARAEET